MQIKTAIILAGGRGTRLGVLTDDTPKPLLPVAGKPFIQYVIDNLISSGITRIILSVGYKADQFRAFIEKNTVQGIRLECVEEATPLGTGGAVRLAAKALDEPFFVLNGDTIFDCDLNGLASCVLLENALAGIALRTVEDSGRYGAIEFDGKNILAFHEKNSSKEGLINGGVYLLSPKAVQAIPEGVCSLESLVFPKFAEEKKLVGTINEEFFLDMGLPETYEASQRLLPEWEGKHYQPTVIFDRDGTLIVEKHYLHNPDEVEILEGVIEGLKKLKNTGYRILIATNQAGIGRGYYTVEDMHAVNKRLEDLFALEGVVLDGTYYCPHAPNDTCSCRKPAQGMIEQMRVKYRLHPNHTYVVGDKDCDILLGQNAGMKGILVRTGYGKETEKEQKSKPDFVADSVLDATKWILQIGKCEERCEI